VNGVLDRPLKPRQTGVSIVDVSRDEDVTTTELRLEEGKWPAAPLAPASVWSDAPEPTLIIELHRVLTASEASATFESYEISASVPAIGGPYSFFSWATPDQLDGVTDTALDWQPRKYDGSDHDHCLLTWDKILPGDDAYVSAPEGLWITVPAYERFIRDDQLRLRHKAQPSTST